MERIAGGSDLAVCERAKEFSMAQHLTRLDEIFDGDGAELGIQLLKSQDKMTPLPRKFHRVELDAAP